MNTLVRSSTLSLTRRFEGYEHLYPSSEKMGEDNYNGWRTFSKRKRLLQAQNMITSLSYRRDRARKRGIFLKTYKLTSIDTSGKSTSRKLKKLFAKVKSVVVSVVAFARTDSLSSCNCMSAISASSPLPVQKKS